MFAMDLMNNPRIVEKQHLPSDTTREVHPISSDHFPLSQKLRMAPQNRFNNQRIKPQTQINLNLFTIGNQVDYYITTGYTEKLYLEVEANVVNAPVTLNVEFLIDRVEIISNGNILSTVRDYNLYHSWLFKTYDQSIRELPSYNKNTSFVPQSLAVGFHRFYIPLKTFVDNCQPKLNIIKGGLLFRIYFSEKGVVTGLNTNVNVSLADIIAQTQQLSNQLESLESQRKQNKMLKYRFLNPIRAASETIAMNANQQYNFRLTSLNSLSAYLVFHITLVGNDPDDFAQIDSFELLDQNNVLVSLKTSHEQSRLVSLSLPGYIATLKTNIYLIPFSFPTMADNGSQSGFYKMTTMEQIKVYTSSTWTNGNYTFECYSYDYNTLILDKGVATVSK